MSNENKKEAPFTCKYCCQPSWIDPYDQSPPPDTNSYLHKNEIPYQKFMELWNTDLTENQRDIIHKLFDQLKNVSADRNGFAVTIQNKNKEIAKLEAEVEMLKQMLLEAEENGANQNHCFAVYRNIPHEGSFVTKLFATEDKAKDWIEAGRAFQEANPMPKRPEWNSDIEGAESFVGSPKHLDYIAKTEKLNAANAGRYLDEGETFSIKQLEINQQSKK